MAGADSGEKIYPPSEEKLRKSKREGQWFKSRDLAGSVVMAAAAAFCTFGLGLFDRLHALFVYSLDPRYLALPDVSMRIEAASSLAWQTILQLVGTLGAVLFCISFLIMYIQVGGIFSLKPVSFKMESINPAQGFQRMFFKGKTYQQLALNILKLSLIMVLVFFALEANIRDLVLSARMGLGAVTHVFLAALSGLLWKCAGIYLVFGIGDFMIQRHTFMKDQAMTDEEMRREMREQEMSPETRQRLAERRRELLDAASEGGLDRVPNCIAVGINPTHLAVGIEYNPDVDIPVGRPPRVAAKGSGIRAAEIVRRAKSCGVPVIRNIPLTRSLFRVKLGRPVPPALFQAMDVLLQELDALAENDGEAPDAAAGEPLPHDIA